MKAGVRFDSAPIRIASAREDVMARMKSPLIL